MSSPTIDGVTVAGRAVCGDGARFVRVLASVHHVAGAGDDAALVLNSSEFVDSDQLMSLGC
jgi:hypothetical protein